MKTATDKRSTLEKLGDTILDVLEERCTGEDFDQIADALRQLARYPGTRRMVMRTSRFAANLISGLEETVLLPEELDELDG